MVKGLLVFRIFILAVNLIAATISLTTLYTAASGELVVELPDPEDVTWNRTGDTIFFETEVFIKNGGLYEITDVVLEVGLRNATEYRVIDHQTEIDNIPARDERTETITVPLNLTRLVRDGLERLIFEPDELFFWVKTRASYTAGLVKFSADYYTETIWEPIIKQLVADKANITISYRNETFGVKIPYLIETAQWLSGNVDAYIEVRNATTLLSSNTTRIKLGGISRSSLGFQFSAKACRYLITHDDSWIFTVGMVLSDVESDGTFSKSFPYKWRAPLSHLSVKNVSLYADSVLNFTLDFTNNASYPLEGRLYTAAYNTSGILAGNNLTELSVEPGQSVAENISIELAQTSPGGGIYILDVEIIEPTLGLNYTTRFSVGG